MKTCPDSDIKTLSAAPREDDLARDVRQSNIGTANSNLPNRGTNKKEKLFTGDKSMSKDILSNELKTKGLPKSLLPPEPNSLTQATSNEQNKRTGHTSKSTKLEQDVPNQTKKQTQEDQSRTLDQEISSNLAQIVRNTERLEDYIRTTRGNDNTRANDSQRKPTDTAYTRANTRPDENESDIIQSELDETHRLVERNRRNLLHYKQQFGINSNYGPGNSSQRDSEGQNDTLTPVQSTSQIGKGTTSHTPSSKKPKRRISAIVISDDEEDGQINSPPIKRILGEL